MAEAPKNVENRKAPNPIKKQDQDKSVDSEVVKKDPTPAELIKHGRELYAKIKQKEAKK